MNHNEDDLKNAFASLRQADSVAAPGFASMRKNVKPRSRRTLTPFLVLAAAGLAMLLTVSQFIDRTDQQDEVVRMDLARARWVSPTDFLLDTPNSDLLRTVPRLWTRPAAPRAPSTLENNQG